MSDIQKAVELAFKAFKEKYGQDAKLEDGDSFVCVFNNCVLIISLEDGKLKEEFVGGRPLEVDYALKIYEREDEENE